MGGGRRIADGLRGSRHQVHRSPRIARCIQLSPIDPEHRGLLGRPGVYDQIRTASRRRPEIRRSGDGIATAECCFDEPATVESTLGAQIARIAASCSRSARRRAAIARLTAVEAYAASADRFPPQPRRSRRARAGGAPHPSPRQYSPNRGTRPRARAHAWPRPGRQTLDQRVVVGVVEERDRQPRPPRRAAERRVHDAVHVRQPPVIGPAHQQIADVHDEALRRRGDVDPLAGARQDLKPAGHVLAGEDREPAIVGVGAGPELPGRRRHACAG